MTKVPAVKGRRAAARRPVDAAPQEIDRLDRMEKLLGKLMDVVLKDVGVTTIHAKEEMAAFVTVEPDDEEKVDRAGEIQARRERELREDATAAEVVATLIDPRHFLILEWLCNVQGKRQAQVLKEILRSALIRERPAYREAQGGGGNSSRNIGTLAERLARK